MDVIDSSRSQAIPRLPFDSPLCDPLTIGLEPLDCDRTSDAVQQPKRCSVTVALAAICNSGSLIVAAEDRMVTAGDTEFERPQPKFFKLANSSVALIFGDIPAQAEVATTVQRELEGQGNRSVTEIASLYASYLGGHRHRLAAAAFLAPLGLTGDTFLARQATMNTELVCRVAGQMQNFQVDGGAIIAGTDERGAHLYHVDQKGARCVDSIGFATAGAGDRHAASEFMVARYTRDWPFDRALFTLYAAKKRAEVAPFVGSQTDVLLISDSFGVRPCETGSPLLIALEETYRGFELATNAARERAHEDIRPLLESIGRTAPVTLGEGAGKVIE
jgi:hypothetical protein